MDPSAFVRGQLPSLLTTLQNSDVRELIVEEGGVMLRLHRAEPLSDETALPIEVVPEPEAAVQSVEVTAGLVGTFYRSPRPGMPPLIAEGDEVNERTVVGIIEALNVLTEVEAGVNGRVTRLLAADGQAVQYGQPLLEVQPIG